MPVWPTWNFCRYQSASVTARAEEFAERTDAKVAIASTRVPTAVASDATVAHSVTVTAAF